MDILSSSSSTTTSSTFTASPPSLPFHRLTKSKSFLASPIHPPARPYQVTEKLKKAVGYWLLLDFVCLLYSTLLRLSLVSVRPLLSNHVAITNKKRGGGSGDGKSSFHPICSGPPASKESFSFSSLAMSVATTTTTAIITNSPYLFVGSFLLRWPSSSYSIENSNCAKPRVKGIV